MIRLERTGDGDDSLFQIVDCAENEKRIQAISVGCWIAAKPNGETKTKNKKIKTNKKNVTNFSWIRLGLSYFFELSIRPNSATATIQLITILIQQGFKQAHGSVVLCVMLFWRLPVSCILTVERDTSDIPPEPSIRCAVHTATESDGCVASHGIVIAQALVLTVCARVHSQVSTVKRNRREMLRATRQQLTSFSSSEEPLNDATETFKAMIFFLKIKFNAHSAHNVYTLICHVENRCDLETKCIRDALIKCNAWSNDIMSTFNANSFESLRKALSSAIGAKRSRKCVLICLPLVQIAALFAPLAYSITTLCLHFIFTPYAHF